MKAGADLQAEILGPGQRILFLSFARATVTRVMQEARLRIPAACQKLLEISTKYGENPAFFAYFEGKEAQFRCS